ncbi:unnamed protein product [Absidia cylindrospora]
MAAMIQHSPVALRVQQQQQHKETQDVTSNKHAQGKMRFNQSQDGWTYPQDWQQQQQYINNPYYYSYQQQQYPPPPNMYHSPQHRSHRPRTQSSPSNSNIQPQKSSSTPTSYQQHYQQRQQRKPRPSPSSIVSSSSSSSSNDARRPKSMLMQQPPSSRPIPMPSNNRPGSIVDSGRRSSVASTSSTVSQSVSIRSEMSLGTKASLSKRLRKVFSVSSLRSSSKGLGSLDGASSSNVSLATIDMIPEENGAGFSSPISPSTPPQRSLRRRSLASLSTLFQKSAPAPLSSPQPQPSLSNLRRPSAASAKNVVQPADKKDRPTLRVDTTQPTMTSSSSSTTRKGPFIVAPDSPNSSVSTRSPITRPTGPHRLASELPSPTPSASSSASSSSTKKHHQQQKSTVYKNDDDSQLADDFGDLAMAPPPVIGVHYGLPMHGSPRLKPAASSSSSSLIMDQVTPLPTTSSSSGSSSSKRRLQFCPTVQVHETFTAADYDRRCDTNATCQKLTPSLALKIKQEINEYKLTEMDVHLESRQYTQFFL